MPDRLERVRACDVDAMFNSFLAMHRHAMEAKAPRPTEIQRNTFARELMALVAVCARQGHYEHALRRAGLELDDFAQDVALFVMARIERFVCRLPWAEAGAKALVAAMRTTIVRKLCDVADRPCRERGNFSAAVRAAEAPASAEVPNLIEGKEDHIIMGIDGGQALLDLHAAALAKGDVLQFKQLPASIRRATTPEQHALLALRANRVALAQ